MAKCSGCLRQCAEIEGCKRKEGEEREGSCGFGFLVKTILLWMCYFFNILVKLQMNVTVNVTFNFGKVCIFLIVYRPSRMDFTIL